MRDSISIQKRIDWIDTAKGIGMLLVIFNHVCLFGGLKELRLFNVIITDLIYQCVLIHLYHVYLISGLVIILKIILELCNL